MARKLDLLPDVELRVWLAFSQRRGRGASIPVVSSKLKIAPARTGSARAGCWQDCQEYVRVRVQEFRKLDETDRRRRRVSRGARDILWQSSRRNSPERDSIISAVGVASPPLSRA